MQGDNDIAVSTKKAMQKSISHLENELAKIRAGKASPDILNGIVVDYYGSPTPIGQAGNINIMDARTLIIQPWEKNMLQPIERAIIAANIGINPQNDGNVIRLFMPPLTEERRKELVKRSYNEGEQAKISIRALRRDAVEQIKKEQKEGLSEDAARDLENNIQNLTNHFTNLIDKYLETKQKEIMVV